MNRNGRFPRTLILAAWFFTAGMCVSTVVAAAGGDTWSAPALHIGVNAGYSSLSGHYASELNDSLHLGLSLIPFSSRYLLGELDLTYSAYELSGSDGSYLYSTAINAGPLLNLPLSGTFSLYAGLLARGNYFYLDTHNLDRQENTFKPGFSVRAGTFIALPLGLRLRAGIDCSQVWLSGTPFRSYAAHAGISYNLLHISSGEYRETREKLSVYSQVDLHYNAGVRKFNEGELKDAKESFARVLALKADHADSRSYMDRIVETENEYARAEKHLETRDYFAAIPHLSRAEANMKEARAALADVRAKLAPQVPEMERRGIRAYDAGEYGLCIDLMNRVKLIEPDNKTVRIYLPRAEKRQEALKKLK
ncbi:MAG: hypothetical protein KBA61_07800 [Spirochaetes bacterium]|nr:hypothetical protein [Spirochaetota bacterium]